MSSFGPTKIYLSTLTVNILYGNDDDVQAEIS